MIPLSTTDAAIRSTWSKTTTPVFVTTPQFQTETLPKRVVSRAKTSGNLKNASAVSRIKAVVTEIRTP